MSNYIHSHKLLSSDIKFLGERIDPLTLESFTQGSEVVICKKCNTLQSYETWIEFKGANSPQEPCCLLCQCTETKQFSISLFNTKQIHIKKNKINISKSTRPNKGQSVLQSFVSWLKELNIFDRILDVCLATKLFRIASIILVIVAGVSSYLLYSNDKLDIHEFQYRVNNSYLVMKTETEEISSKVQLSFEELDKSDDKLRERNEYIKSNNSIKNEQFINEMKNVNSNISEWIDEFIEWVDDLL